MKMTKLELAPIDIVSRSMQTGIKDYLYLDLTHLSKQKYINFANTNMTLKPTIQSTIGTRIQIEDWDYKESNTQEYTHGILMYPARMVPQIARRLIQTY
ncbi:MAG: hypothetical protein ACE5KT_11370, partial [Methanosarcinales archaeon]